MFAESPKFKADPASAAPLADVEALVAALGSDNYITRQRARSTLVYIGEPAISALIEALEIGDETITWEAIKALSQIGSPKSVQVLVQTLEDEQFNIRWLAAEGLIKVGQAGLEALLQALVNRSNSVWLREGAHHILHDMVDRGVLDRALSQQVAPVLAALEGIEPAVAAPVAAKKVLQTLKK
jgi:HEAT repeat protein